MVTLLVVGCCCMSLLGHTFNGEESRYVQTAFDRSTAS